MSTPPPTDFRLSLAPFEHDIFDRLRAEHGADFLSRMTTNSQFDDVSETCLNTVHIDGEPVVEYRWRREHLACRRELVGEVTWLADRRRAGALRGIGLSRFPGLCTAGVGGSES